jgi:dTDP-4-amino-4,6-dideoxygalactose transaminase
MNPVKHAHAASDILAVDGGAPARSTFLPYHQPWLGPAEEASVIETMRSGWITTGPRTKAFEQQLATYVGAKHCVAVNSCTAALHLALEAVGVGPGDEVITSPITFASTANVIVHRGATPVLVDVEPDTINMDASRLEAAITPKTKAVIPVHLFGQPCDMDAINAIARRHGIAVIEDAAHAIGAEYKGEPIGGSGNLTAFSFYATKNITSGGEGGALTTNDAEMAERVAIMSLHGISKDAWKRYSASGFKHYDIVYPGYKYNMFDLQAAVAIPQLAKIETFWARRKELKARLDAALRNVPEIILPAERSYAKHAHHLYPIMVRTEDLTVDRDGVMNAIQKENVGVGVHFRAVHVHPYYIEHWGFRRGMFPNAEYYSDRAISLPLYPKMTDADADDVIRAVLKVIAAYRKTDMKGSHA